MGTMFSVKMKNVQDTEREMLQVSRLLRNSSEEIRSIKGSLSFENASRSRIERKLLEEIAKLSGIARNTEQMEQQLRVIAGLYAGTEARLTGKGTAMDNSSGKSPAADRIRDLLEPFRDPDSGAFPRLVKEILNRLKELSDRHPGKSVMDLMLMLLTGGMVLADLKDIPGTSQNGASETDSDKWKTGPWSLLKNLTDLAGKYQKDVKERKKSGNILGLGADGMSYIESLADFLTGDKRGATGASDVCDLADSSCGLWNGIYKLVEEKYKDAFKYTDKTGEHLTPFGKKWSRVSDSVSIIGDIAGWGGDILDIFDDKKNPTGADKNTAFFKSSTHVVDIASTIYDIKNKTDAAGLYTPAGIYGVVANTGINTFSTAYRDVSKLSADGKFDVDDLAQTMLDSSTEGLCTMVDKLSFGLISEDTTGISPQQVSDALRDGAKGWGQEAGQRIVNDPVKLRIYNNGNGFTKACVMTESIVETGADYVKEGAKTAAKKTVEAAGKAWEGAKKAGEAIDSFMPWRRW